MRFLFITILLTAQSCRQPVSTKHKVEGKTESEVHGSIELGADFDACKVFQKQPDKERCVNRILDILEKKESCE